MSSIIMAANAVSNGMAVFKPLYWLFGKCMEFLLDVLNNQYFIALIIFTVVTRLLLLPLNVKQQKSMAATTRLQPKIQKINKKYPDPRDRDKLNRENHRSTAHLHRVMTFSCIKFLHFPVKLVPVSRVRIFFINLLDFRCKWI